jgi:hypothetical protein
MPNNVSTNHKWLARLEAVISFCLVLNLFLMRPAALGQTYTTLAILGAAALVGLYVIAFANKKIPAAPRLRFEMLSLFVLMTLYWIYIYPVSLFFDRTDMDLLYKGLLTEILILVPYGVFLSGTNANRTFFRQCCTVIALLGYSSLITAVLSLILGSRDPLFLFTLQVKGYTEASVDQTAAVGAVYFPLSMLYSDFVADAVTLERYSGFFREAGIYQAFACFCLAYEAYTRRSKLVMAGLVIGVIFAFSSLGIVLVMATLGLVFLVGRRGLTAGRALIAVISVALCYPIAVYTPYIGLSDKADTHAASLSDRSLAIIDGLRTVAENPLGYGLFSNLSENGGICLIASLAQVGLFGFLCQFIMLSGWRPGPRQSWPKIVACMPLLVTALISQPIAAAPATTILLMAYLPAVRRSAAGRRQYVAQPLPGLSGNA